MAWQEVTPDLGGSRKGRCLWSIKVKYGGARLTVPVDIASKLGWTASTALSLQVGTGNDAGMLRLIEHPNGAIRAMKPYANAKSLQYRLGFWNGLPRQDQEQSAMRSDIYGGALILHPPVVAQKVGEPINVRAAVPPPPADTDNARGQPLKPAPRPSTSIMSGPPPERPTAAKRDVTAQFFDDPKRPVQMASGVRSNVRTS